MDQYPESVVKIIFNHIKETVNKNLQKMEKQVLTKYAETSEQVTNIKALQIKNLDPSLVKDIKKWSFIFPCHQFDFLKHSFVNYSFKSDALLVPVSELANKWYFVKNRTSIRNFYPKTIFFGFFGTLGVCSYFLWERRSNRLNTIYQEEREKRWKASEDVENSYYKGRKEIINDITNNNQVSYNTVKEYIPLILHVENQKKTESKKLEDKAYDEKIKKLLDSLNKQVNN